MMQTSPQFEEAIKNDLNEYPGGHQALTSEGVLVAQVFLQNELRKLEKLSGKKFTQAIGIIKRSTRLETLRGIAYSQNSLKGSIEAQLRFDKILSDPQQLEQHLEHETRAAMLSGGEGMEQP